MYCRIFTISILYYTIVLYRIAGVGKHFMIEGRMGLQQACRGPDVKLGVRWPTCHLGLSHESCCCWCSGCRLLIAVAGVAYQIAVSCSLSHGHWMFCVSEMPGHVPLCRWRGVVIMLQLTGRRGPHRQILRAGFGTRAGLFRPLPYRIYTIIYCTIYYSIL